MWSRTKYFARETVISLRRNLLMTLAGVLTVAVSLTLFGGIVLLSDWVGHGTAKWKGGVRLEIYMNREATQAQIDDIAASLDEDPDVASYRYKDKEAAYEEFKRLFSDKPELVETVDAEALPASFLVAPREAELTETVKDRYTGLAGVESAIDPGDSLRGLLTVTRVLRVIFYALAGVLLAASVFLIFNTIRLATFARRREIEVMKLVGASNWFVRIPFILEGVIQGVLGAGVAIALVYLGKWAVDTHLEVRDDGFFQGFFLDGRDAHIVAAVCLLLGFASGFVGSLLGLRRFLRV